MVRAGSGFQFTHAVAFESDTMGVMDDAVEDSVGGSGSLVMSCQLAGGRTGSEFFVALLEDFEPVKLLRISQRPVPQLSRMSRLGRDELVDETLNFCVSLDKVNDSFKCVAVSMSMLADIAVRSV